MSHLVKVKATRQRWKGSEGEKDREGERWREKERERAKETAED